MIQIVLNGLLSAGVLITASALAGRAETWDKLPELPAWTGGPRSLVWLAAMLLVLPLLVVTYRKLRATALVLAEMAVPRVDARETTDAARSIVSTTILTAGTVAVLLTLLLLSATILPPWPVLLVLLTAVALLVAFRWRRLERLYASAQSALTETLTRPPEVVPEPPKPMPSLLKDAQLETFEIAPGSVAAGKLIRELALRSRSGASAVGIERRDASVINPGPDEEIQAGDRVLLLGSRAQLGRGARRVG